MTWGFIAKLIFSIAITIVIALLGKKWKFRLLFLIGLLVSLVVFVSLRNSRIPPEENLVPLHGKVTEVKTITSHTDDLVFRLDSSPLIFKYLDNYPYFQEVQKALQERDSLTVWIVPGAVDKKNRVAIWGRDTVRGHVVLYEDRAKKTHRNRLYGFLVGIFFVGCTVWGATWLVHERWKGRQESD